MNKVRDVIENTLRHETGFGNEVCASLAAVIEDALTHGGTPTQQIHEWLEEQQEKQLKLSDVPETSAWAAHQHVAVSKGLKMADEYLKSLEEELVTPVGDGRAAAREKQKKPAYYADAVITMEEQDMLIRHCPGKCIFGQDNEGHIILAGTEDHVENIGAHQRLAAYREMHKDNEPGLNHRQIVWHGKRIDLDNQLRCFEMGGYEATCMSVDWEDDRPGDDNVLDRNVVVIATRR